MRPLPILALSLVCLVLGAGGFVQGQESSGKFEIAAAEGFSTVITTDGRIFWNPILDDKATPQWTYSGRMMGLSARPISISATRQMGTAVVFHVICADGRHYRLKAGKDRRGLGPILPDTAQAIADVFADAQARLNRR